MTWKPGDECRRKGREGMQVLCPVHTQLEQERAVKDQEFRDFIKAFNQYKTDEEKRIVEEKEIKKTEKERTDSFRRAMYGWCISLLTTALIQIGGFIYTYATMHATVENDNKRLNYILADHDVMKTQVSVNTKRIDRIEDSLYSIVNNDRSNHSDSKK
jgi:hypothetical protein